MAADTTATRAVFTAPAGTFVTVPADVARYGSDVEFTARSLRIPVDQLERLAKAGLPHRTDPERGMLFDYVDLVNAATFSGSGQSFPELALRFQVKFATEPEPSWYEPRGWQLTVRAPDGDGGPYRLVPPDLTAPGVEPLEPGGEVERQPLGYRAAVRLTGSAATVRDPRAVQVWTDLLAELVSGAVSYQTVPEALRTDHERAWALGMADCIVAAQVLTARLRASGLQARARRGYLIGLLGSEHAWCELYEDDRWKALDPVFAFAAGGGRGEKRFVNLPEFARACRGGRFNRLLPCSGEGAQALVWSGAEPAAPWLPAVVSVAARPAYSEKEPTHAG
jgi:transglutaminase-like putative cysteine protease